MKGKFESVEITWNIFSRMGLNARMKWNWHRFAYGKSNLHSSGKIEVMINTFLKSLNNEILIIINF